MVPLTRCQIEQRRKAGNILVAQATKEMGAEDDLEVFRLAYSCAGFPPEYHLDKYRKWKQGFNACIDDIVYDFCLDVLIKKICILPRRRTKAKKKGGIE